MTMTPHDLRNLQESYQEMYQLDEVSDKKVQQVVNARNRRFARSNPDAPNREFHQAVRSNKLAARRNARTGSNVRTDPDIDGTRGIPSREETSRMREIKVKKESFDLFDTILDHLISEGYADNAESALVIMANMSEEWKQSIMEGPAGMMMSAASQGKGQLTQQKPQPQKPDPRAGLTPMQRLQRRPDITIR